MINEILCKTLDELNEKLLAAYPEGMPLTAGPLLDISLESPLSREEILHLIGRIARDKIPCRVRLPQGLEDIRLLDVYLKNKRGQLVLQLQEAGLLNEMVVPVDVPKEDGPVNWARVSRAKVNLSRGKVEDQTKEDKGRLQVQHQHTHQFQRQQQMQQQQTTQTLLDKRTEQLAKRESAIKPIFERGYNANIGELVNESNINQLFSQKHNKIDLTSCWRDLVGDYANEMTKADLSRAITHVQKEAMSKIIENRDEFKYGVVLDNLPAGFFLQKTEDKLVLCYQANRPKPLNTPHALLAIQLPDEKRETSLGDARQWAAETDPGYQTIKVQFERLIGADSVDDKLRAFAALATKDHDDWKDNLSSLINFLDLNTSTGINGLTKALIAGGAEAVILLLNKLVTLKIEKAYDKFKMLFLDNHEDYSELVTVDGMKNLDAFSKLSISEKIWWHHLTQQHADAKPGKPNNFNELFSAFDYFNNEVKRITGEDTLPNRCQFPGIKNMKVAMNRLLRILGRSVDKQEQLEHLKGLDLTSEGAFYASQCEDYKLTIERMELTQTFKRKPTEQRFNVRILVYNKGSKENEFSLLPSKTLNVMNQSKDEIFDAVNDAIDTHVGAKENPFHDRYTLSHVKSLNMPSARHIGNKGISGIIFRYPMKNAKYAIRIIVENIHRMSRREIMQLKNKYMFGYHLPEKYKTQAVEDVDDSDHLFGYASNKIMPALYGVIANEKYFYRYIGEQDWALPLAYYEHAAAGICSMTYFDPSTGDDKQDVHSVLYQQIDKDDDILAMYEIMVNYRAPNIFFGLELSPGVKDNYDLDNISGGKVIEAMYGGYLEKSESLLRDYPREVSGAFEEFFRLSFEQLVGDKPTRKYYIGDAQLCEEWTRSSSAERNVTYFKRFFHAMGNSNLESALLSNRDQFEDVYRISMQKLRDILSPEIRKNITRDNYIQYVQSMLDNVTGTSELALRGKYSLEVYLGMLKRWRGEFKSLLMLDEWDDLKYQLLHLSGLCTTHKRQLMRGCRYDDVDEFTKAVSSDIKSGRNSQANAQAYCAMVCNLYQRLTELKEVMPDLMPTLHDLAGIWQYWRLDSKESSNRNNDIPNKILELVNRFGTCVYSVIDISLQRERMQLKNMDVLIFFNHIDGNELIDYKELTKKHRHLTINSIIETVAIFSDVNQLTHKQRISFANYLGDLPESLSHSVIKAVKNIKVTESQGLPTYEDLMRVIKMLDNRHQEKPFDLASMDVEVAEFLQRQFPMVHLIEQRKVESSLAGIVEGVMVILRDKFSSEPLSRVVPLDPYVLTPTVEELNGLFPNLGSSSEKLVKALVEIRNLLFNQERQSVTVDVVLSAIKKVDDEANAFLNSMTFKAMLNVIQAVIPSEPSNDLSQADNDFKAYYTNTKKVMFLVKPLLQNFIIEALKDKLSELRVSNEQFLSYLQQQLGEIDESKSIDEAIRDYAARFDTVTEFIRILISVSNDNTSDFKKLFATLDRNKERLTFAQHHRLINIISKSHQVPVSARAEIIYDLMADPTLSFDRSNDKRIKHALDQLSVLVGYEAIIPADAYKLILKLSMKHHLTKETLFPFKSLVGLYLQKTPSSQSTFNLIIDKLNEVTPASEAKINEAIVVTGSLLESDTTDTGSRFIHAMMQLFECQSKSDWDSYLTTIKSLPNDRDKCHQMLTVLVGVMTTRNHHDRPKKDELTPFIAMLSTLSNEQLIRLSRLYQFQPYPTKAQLLPIIALLVEGKNNQFNDAVQRFDLDPFGERNEQSLKEQFSLAQAKRVISHIERLPDKETLPAAEQRKLMQQLTYINSIGHKMAVRKEMLGIQGAAGNESSSLTNFSRLELKQAGMHLIKRIRDVNVNESNKEKAKLALCAILREVYFRTCGIFPYSTQMIAVLMSINHPGHLLMQLNTGEGKSILSPLLLMQEWASQAAVNFSTANPDLARRDSAESSLFYQFFDTPTSLNQYATNGINYGTMADTSLSVANAKLFGEKRRLSDWKPTSLFIDESDADMLYTKTSYNLANSGEVNPNAWIYPMINDFVDKPAYQNIDPNQGEVWSQSKDLHELKLFLGDKIIDPVQKAQLKTFSNDKLSRWIESATLAKQHREGNEYLIQHEKRKVNAKDITVSLAVPLDKNVLQVGSTRENGIQQFLHARLQTKMQLEQPDKDYYFPIDDESFKTATETSKNFIERHAKKGGRLVGTSATLGSMVELAEQESKFQVEAYSIPPHLPSQRIELSMRVTQDDRRHVEAIKQDLLMLRSESKKLKSVQPTLIVCKDMEAAEKLYANLSNVLATSGMQFQCVTGKESAADRDRMVLAAANTNMITISTSLLGRGTDIKVDKKKEPRGLCVLQTYLDNESSSRQFMGRCARNGMIGRFLAFIKSSEGIKRYGIDLSKFTGKKREAQLQAIYRRMDEDNAVERYYLQEMDGVQNVLLDHFQRWHKLIMATNNMSGDIERTLLERREKIIDDVRGKWQALLEDSDKEKKYSNVYLRRSNTGELEDAALDKCVQDLEQYVVDYWNRELSDLKKTYLPSYQPMDLAIEPTDVNDDNAARYVYLNQLAIEHRLNERKLKPVRDELYAKHITTRQAVELDAASDVSGAMLQYAENLTSHEKSTYLTESTEYQLTVAVKSLAKLIPKSWRPSVKEKKLKASLTRLEGGVKNNDINGKVMDAAVLFAEDYYANCQRVEDTLKLQSFTGVLLTLNNRSNEYKQPICRSETSDKLDKLKVTYFDQGYHQLAIQLKQAFKWRKGKWWHQLLERKVGRQAAEDILACVNHNESSTNSALKFKNLYKVLITHQEILKDKHMFSFLHENVKSSIRKGIESLEALSAVDHHLGVSLSHIRVDAEQSAMVDVYQRAFDQLLRQAESKVKKSDQGAFQALKETLELLSQQNRSLLVFAECKAKLDELDQLGQFKVLSKNLEKLVTQIEEEVPNHHLHLSLKSLAQVKSAQWRERLEGIHLSVHTKHTGFKEYIEVVVHAKSKEDRAKFAEMGFKEMVTTTEMPANLQLKSPFFDTKRQKLADKATLGVAYVKQLKTPKEVFEFDATFGLGHAMKTTLKPQ